MPPIRALLATLFVLVLTVAPLVVHADTLPDPDSIEPRTRAFMQKVAKGKVTEAYSSLAPYLGVSQKPFDASAKEADTYLQKVFDRAGKTLDIDRVKREAIDGHFYREAWLQKFAEAVLAWQFTFYRASNGWKLVGISYTTDIESLYTRY